MKNFWEVSALSYLKKIFATVIVLVAAVASVCGAVGKNDFSLGGVWLNMPYNDVVKMYGQPTSRPGGYAQLVTDVIKYGNGVEIGFLGKNVRYVVTTANNGWKTPSGLHVGMSIDEAIRICGTDYKTSTRSQSDIPDWMRSRPYLYLKWTGKKYSWSRVTDIYSYAPGDTSFVLSVVENGGKVSAIILDQITPEY